MATVEAATYPIPPPPLPEFYQCKRDIRMSSSSSTPSIKVDDEALPTRTTLAMVDGALDGGGKGARPTQPPSIYPTVIPATYFGPEQAVPPLAIYHICRVCLRPRSPRYHREHPIPLDGLPPPPGICRRCRVMTVEETQKVADVVFTSESNKVKIGCITPFVPDEDIISNKEMREMRSKAYLQGRLDERSSPCHKTTQRYVRVIDGSDGPVRRRTTKVTFTRSRSRDSTSDDPAEPAQAIVTAPEEPVLATNAMKKIDSTKASISTKASETGSTVKSKTSTRHVTEIAEPVQPGCTEEDVRAFAREEIERYYREYWKTIWTDDRIRKLAREEVERYRQAERRLEAHPDPYAHGRMVPVHHQIEKVRDTAEAMPWSMQPEDEQRSRPGSRGIEARVNVKAGSGRAKKIPISWSSTSSRSAMETKALKTGRALPHDPPFEQQNDDRGLPGSFDRQHDRGGPIHTRVEVEVRNESQPGEAFEPIAPRSPLQDVGSRIARESKTGTRTRSNAVPDLGISEQMSSRHSHHKLVEGQERGNTKPKPVPTRTMDWVYQPSKFRVPSTSARVDEVAIDVDQDNHRRRDSILSRQSANGELLTRSSQYRSDWYDESVGRTIETRSSAKKEAPPLVSITPAALSGHRHEVEEECGSDLTRWPDEDSARRRSERVQTLRGPPYPEDNSAFNVVAEPQTLIKDELARFRSSPYKARTGSDDAVEYIYTKRTVQPASRSLGREPFDDHLSDSYTHVEITRSKGSAGSRAEPANTDQRRKRHYPPHEPTCEDGDEDMDIAINVRNEARKPSHVPAPSLANEREDSHVQFASKVHITPTPPGSDASSSEIRRYHSVARKKERQLDGSQDRPESPQREVRGQDRAPCCGKPLKRPPGGGAKTSSDRKDKVRDTTDSRRDSPGRKYDGNASRPAPRALSESPSRESLASFRAYTKGPYRESERLTDSMRVRDGSPAARAWEDVHETDNNSWRW